VQAGSKVLAFRGGALGDLILTLPVLASLRSGYPSVDLQLFGVWPHARLGSPPATAVHDLGAAGLAPLFVENGKPDPALLEVIDGAGLALTYLSDPAGIFGANLRRWGVQRLVAGPYRMSEHGPHAVEQLAAPLAALDLSLVCPFPKVELPTLKAQRDGVDLALHLGSGSSRKNWPWERWRQLVESLQAEGLVRQIALVTGEADDRPTEAFLSGWHGGKVDVWDRLPLPELARRLAGCAAFFGHDSGISHLAAAAGAPVLALFGPTNPRVWAPQGPRVQVVVSPSGQMQALDVGDVLATARTMF
jgi:heptosyltransferase III